VTKTVYGSAWRARVIAGIVPLGAVLAAIALGALLISVAGFHPGSAYHALLKGAFGSMRSLSETLVRFCPLGLSALAVLVGFRAGFFTIGVEGQFYMGALAASIAALGFPALPPLVLIPAVVIAGMAGGALWALIAGVLKMRLGVNEVISTIMLNNIATLLIDYLVRGPLREPGSELQQTPLLPRAAWLPRVLAHTRLHPGVLLPLLAGGLVYLFFWRMSAGYRVRVIGANPTAARYAGISVDRSLLLAVALSGALAGLAGAVEVQGISHRLQAGIGSDYGYTAIPITLLGGMLPGPTLLASFFFAALGVGATMMQLKAFVPLPIVTLLQGLIILFVIGSEGLKRHIGDRAKNA
jgi:general nucleoside transport system permease protein